MNLHDEIRGLTITADLSSITGPQVHILSEGLSHVKSHRIAPSVATLVAVVVTLAVAANVSLAGYTFTKVIDTLTAIPGESSRFSNFQDVSFDGSNVAFVGKGADDEAGVYQWAGGTLSTIADQSTPRPIFGSGFSSAFTDFSRLSLDNGAVVFQGKSETVEGIYTNLGGGLEVVADATTQMPGSSVFFSQLFATGVPGFDVSISGENILFSGFGNVGGFNEGVYRATSNGFIERIADRSTVPPGDNEPFVFFRGDLGTSGDEVLFTGRASGSGIYTSLGTGGDIRTVIDSNSTLPSVGTSFSFSAPNTYQIDGPDTAFRVSDSVSFDSHFYIESSGTIREVVNQSDIHPATNTPFRVLGNRYSLDDGKLLFTGWADDLDPVFRSIDGLFLSDDTGFEMILSDGDQLDGKTITSLSVYGESLEGGSFAFEARFDDDSRAIYLAEATDTPDPGSVTLIPTFDVQLRPGNEYPLGDAAGDTIEIDGGSGTNFPILNALLEFPLAGVPEDADITSVTLTVDPQLGNSLTIEALGYAGDGLASLSDESVVTELIGSGSVTGADLLEIPLDIDFFEALLGEQSHLGLRLASSTTGPFNRIASSESSTGAGPTLRVEYTLSQLPGDFNGDGSVDLLDLDILGQSFGQQGDSTFAQGDANGDGNVDLLDLDILGANFGNVTATTVPEPAALLAALTGALLAVSPVSRRW